MHQMKSTVARTAAALAVAAISVGALAGCSGGSEAAPENPIAEAEVPDYYPADYQDIIDESKDEGGTLTIYSNTDQEAWDPIFRDFKKKYPWVTTINANNLDSDEVFQRQLAESASGSSTADLLVSNAAQAWAEFAEDPERLLEYQSPELDKLPEFAEVLPSVYAVATDPIGLAYNSQLVTEAPTGVASLAELVEADPDKFADKITTRDVGGAFGFTVSHAFAEASDDAWTSLEAILPSARPESSSGSQAEKVLSGEYLAGFFISSSPGYNIEETSGGLFKFVLPDDGTVVLPRGAGIAADAPNPATAKLFIDFVLSEEGQNAVSEGGLTSYRDSVEPAEGRHTYKEVEDAVGEDKVILVDFTLVPEAEVTEFVDRWNGLLG